MKKTYDIIIGSPFKLLNCQCLLEINTKREILVLYIAETEQYRYVKRQVVTMK